jgi:hypothetical protein
MFDQEIRAEVMSAKVKVTEDGNFKFRMVRMVLVRDFDDEAAAIIGGDSRIALDCLRQRGMTKAILPIDAVSARGVLVGKERIEIERISGMKVTCSLGKAKEDEAAPIKVKLEFEFKFQKEAFALLGDETGDTVSLTLTRNQLDLPGTSKTPLTAAAPPAETKANGKKTRTPRAKLGTKSSHGADRAEAAGEIIDPQDADTPEEAEELRAQRMREQRQADDEVWTDGATVS